MSIASPSSVAHGGSADSLCFQFIHDLVTPIGSLHFHGRRGLLLKSAEEKSECLDLIGDSPSMQISSPE